MNGGLFMRTRVQQKEERYNEILKIALTLFIKKGYSATKISDIAKHANMSTGLLFYYFTSKEALYLELVKIGTSAPLNLLHTIETNNPIQFFEVWIEQIFNYAKESCFTAQMFVFMSNSNTFDDIPEEAKKMRNKFSFHEDIIPIIITGQELGVIRQGNPTTLANTLWVSINGAVQAYAIDSNVTLPEVEWLIDIIRAK